MNLSLSGIRNLIIDVAENARFREETTRQEEFSRTKNVAKAETPMNSMPEEMKQMKEMMVQILQRQPVQIKPCEFCSSTDHKTDACPTILVEDPAEVNAVGGYQGYNTNNNNDKAGPSRQYGQATENVSVVTLRSGRKLAVEPMEQEEDKSPRLPGEEQMRPKGRGTLEQDAAEKNGDAPEEHTPSPMPRTETSKIRAALPFQVSARVPKQHVMDEDVFELFSKVEINIPLLEAIKQIPRYAKFLKELCTNRRRSNRNDQELMSRDVSAVIQRKVPPKCGDPETYTIPCTIGNIRIENCMLDLGASINVLPFSIYSCLRIGPLEPTSLTIQLADRSCKQPEGKIEDVLVQVGELVFPADFYVLKMENNGPTDHAPILLGRPFLKTSKMKIDCGSGMLSMEVEGEIFSFDIFQAMKHPMEFEAIHALDTLDDLVQEVQSEPRADPLELILNGAESPYELTEGLHETLAHLTISEPLTPGYEVNEVKLFKSNTFLPSVMQAPEIELKPLPVHLKYAFLGENNTLPVIIKSGLETDQERHLIKVLRQHKLAIAWTLADLRGVSPAVCMHRILLKDGAKPSREPQRRLNPIMMEIV
ncbi:unnamed protein product [Rhodiola kirilowii]